MTCSHASSLVVCRKKRDNNDIFRQREGTVALVRQFGNGRVALASASVSPAGELAAAPDGGKPVASGLNERSGASPVVGLTTAVRCNVHDVPTDSAAAIPHLIYMSQEGKSRQPD